MDREQLRAAISKAFDNTPDTELHDAWLGHSVEAEGFRRLFRGRRWRELDQSFLLKNKSAVVLLSPWGLVYYLPAFLLLGVDREVEAEQVRSLIVKMLAYGGKSKEVFLSTIAAARNLARKRPEHAAIARQVESAMEEVLADPLPPDYDVLEALNSEQLGVVADYLSWLQAEYGKELVKQDLERAIEVVSERFNAANE